VSLSKASTETVTVQFTTEDGTAIHYVAENETGDFIELSDTVTFDPGETSQTIYVQILDDYIDEPTENFYVNLSNPTNATILDGQGIGTILDNDIPDIDVAGIDAQNVEVTEGEDAVFTVRITGAGEDSTVTLTLANGTAINADYNKARFEYSTDDSANWSDVTGAISVAAGDSDLLVRTDTYQDLVNESDETFTLTGTLTSLGTDYSDTATATIVDDDEPPVAEDVTASGQEATIITVTLSGSDADGTVETYTLTSLPSNGTLYTDAAHTAPAETGTPYENATFYFDADQYQHIGADPKPNTFTYTVTDDGGNVSESATATINVWDTKWTAVNDHDTNSSGVATGDVIYGEAGNMGGADLPGADSVLVTKVTHDASSIQPDGNGETIFGDYGKLIIENDGDYSYQQTKVATTEVANVTTHTSAYAFEHYSDAVHSHDGKAYLTLSELDADAQGHVGEQGGSGSGKKGIGADWGPNSTEDHEAIVFNLGQNTEHCTVDFAQWNANQAPASSWHAYDTDGKEVASGTFSGNYSNGDVQSLDITAGKPFQYLLLTNTSQNQGFVVESVEIQTAGHDVFHYEITDSDGDVSGADLTIDTLDHLVPPPEDHCN